MAIKNGDIVLVRPTARVTNLSAPSRSGNSLKIGWKVPSEATSLKDATAKVKKKTVKYKKDPRFSWVDVDFYLVDNSGKAQAKIECKRGNKWDVASKLTGNDKVWWRDKGASWTECTQPYNRDKYHPVVPGRYLKRAYAGVHGGNAKGEAPTLFTVDYRFEAPRAPSIAAPELDSATQKLSAKVTTDAGADARERYDTMTCIVRQDNFNPAYAGEAFVAPVGGGAGWAASAATELTPAVNMGDALSLALDQWIRMTFKAYARGIAGDSATVEASHVFAHPAQGEVVGVSVNDLSSTGLVRIAVRTNASDLRPVDRCVLQRLKDVQVTTATGAAARSDWQDVEGQVDDGNCQGFTDAVADAITLYGEDDRPTGNRTWYRVATYHDDMPAQYSVPVQATCLHKPAPTAADDKVRIVSAAPGADGTSVVVDLAWDSDDSTATEVSWSANPDAWESTEQPETFDVTWYSGASPSAAGTARLTIRGLSSGVQLYIKARRHDAEGVYGPYSSAVAVTPQVLPSNVQLILPSYVSRGSDLPVLWTFDGTEQDAWTLDSIDADGNQVTLMTGTDAAGSCVLPAAQLAGLDELRLRVGVSAGGGWAYSDVLGVTVKVVDAPALSLDVPSTLAAQPLSLAATTNTPDCRLLVKVSSLGARYTAPDGERVQAAGDSIYSGSFAPAWEELEAGDGEDAAYGAAVTLPQNLPFVDGCAFAVSVVAVSDMTGLSSAERRAESTVAWEHKALPPSDGSAVTVDEEARSAEVIGIAPDGAAETDVFDLYRLTVDGACLIASNMPFGTAVTDRYAPFGDSADLYYRLATRTADGDVEWLDVQYLLDVRELVRLDWDGKHVELRWGASGEDSHSKDAQVISKQDGTEAGYWNRGVRRSMSLRASLLELDTFDESSLLNDMAKHPGPVFVRTSRGHAFQANVDLKGNSFSLRFGKSSVQLECTEVALTDFAAATEDIIIPGSEPNPREGESDD